MEKVKGKLFDGPYGPSEKPWGLSGKTTEHITCAACGTFHPCIKNSGPDEYYSYSIVRIQECKCVIVDKCCGRYLDELNEDVGEGFFVRKVEELINGPISKENTRKQVFLENAISAREKFVKKLRKLKSKKDPPKT